MNKQTLLKVVPYIIIIVSIVFIIYATSTLQNVENQCNTQLKERYEYFKDNACSYCSEELNGDSISNITIDLPGWID